MRATILLLPITLAFAAPLTAAAQDAPRVLFCAGECFAVGASGVRQPAPKGTPLLPGQRLETGPGGYAQVKLSPEAAVGIGEHARVRFDRDAVLLDQGRVRMVGGEAFGKPITRPVELRTTDGTIVLRGADLEAKKTALGSAATPTVVRLNAGDARLGKGPGEVTLPAQAIRGIERGKLAGAPLPITEIVPPVRASENPVPSRPVAALPAGPVLIVSAPVLQPTVTVALSPTLTTSLSTTSLSTSLSTTSLSTTSLSTTTVLTSADLLLNSTVTSSTGTKTLSTALLEPITTATTTTTTGTTSTLSSPTLTTTKSLTLEPTTTLTTCCTTYKFSIR